MKCTWPTRIKPSLPNANYIPLVRVGSRIGCDMLCIGSVMLRVGSAFFRCQHVGIGNASWGSSPAQAPNPSRFVLQWNIGSRLEKPTNEIGSIDFLFKYVQHLFTHPSISSDQIYLVRERGAQTICLRLWIPH